MKFLQALEKAIEAAPDEEARATLQGLHDKYAGDVVVQDSGGNGPPPQ